MGRKSDVIKNQQYIILICIFLFHLVLVGTDATIFAQSYQSKSSKKTEIQHTNTNHSLKMQPVAILSIIPQNDSTWILQVNFLTRNPKWIPSGNDTESFYLHLNPEIIDLTVNS